MATPEHADHDVAHEASDLSAAAIAKVLGVLAAAAAVFIGIVFTLGMLLNDREEAGQAPLTDAQRTVLISPEPRLQAEPWGDLRRLEAREESVLDSYGWLTPARDRARIPLARAQELMVGRPLDGPLP